MANQNLTTFYVGVTNDIKRRVFEHKNNKASSFTNRYNLHWLLYFEEVEGMLNAIQREKQLKNWHRQWKINLVKENNPGMIDLAKEW